MPKSLLMEEELKRKKRAKIIILKALLNKESKTNQRRGRQSVKGRCQLLAFSRTLCSLRTKRIRVPLKDRWTNPTLPYRVQLVAKEYPQRSRTMFQEPVSAEVNFRIKKSTTLKRSLVTQQASKA